MSKDNPPIPATLITGPLGAGKTTLLLHILRSAREPIAVLVNEFGEVGIDSKILEGESLRLVELEDGCVCCSLIGDFEAAIRELLETFELHAIVIETTGVAEPESLIALLSDDISGVTLDGVVTVVDADAMAAFVMWGRTLSSQLESADLVLLNKSDLIDSEERSRIRARIREMNPKAPVVETVHAHVDPEIVLGPLGRTVQRETTAPHRDPHESPFESFTFEEERPLLRECFEKEASRWSERIYRVKGFVSFAGGSGALFNYVAGRFDFHDHPADVSRLVFIGKAVSGEREGIIQRLRECAQHAF